MRNSYYQNTKILTAFKTPEMIKRFLEEYESLFNNHNPITMDDRFKELILDSIYLHFLVELDINLEMNLIVMQYKILKDHMSLLLRRSQEQIDCRRLDKIIKLLEDGIWELILQIDHYGKRYLFDKDIFKLKLFKIDSSKIEFLSCDPNDEI